MIKNWNKFNENKNENIVFDNIDFGIPRYMLDNILLDIKDEFPDMYIDYMSIDNFINYFNESSSGDYQGDLEDELKVGGPKFAITIDKPNDDNDDGWSYKKTVYELEPKIWSILDGIDGMLSMYNLRAWGRDFFYADTEYYIIIEKIK